MARSNIRTLTAIALALFTLVPQCLVEAHGYLAIPAAR